VTARLEMVPPAPLLKLVAPRVVKEVLVPMLAADGERAAGRRH